MLAVRDAAPVPPFATGRVPVTAVLSGTLVIVLLDPLIVLFVNVTVLLAVRTFVGVMMFDRLAIGYSGFTGQTIVVGNPICCGRSRKA